MNRLTKIDRYGHFYTNNANCRNIYSLDGETIKGVFFKNHTLAIDGEAINKLGKLEDLEEQLGCPLEVAFKKCEELKKANEYNEYCVCNWQDEWVILEIDTSYIGEIECNIVYWLSDYKKTWW